MPEPEPLAAKTPDTYTFPGPPPRRAQAGEDTERGMAALEIAACINETCPWSGGPVPADSLTLYDGRVVGLCKTGCSDRFETAPSAFSTGRRKPIR